MDLFQKYITKGYFPNNIDFKTKLKYCQQHLDYYNKYCISPKENFNALELGTGWWPIVSIGLYLSGANEIWTYDIVPVLRMDNLLRVLNLFNEYLDSGEINKILLNLKPERIQTFKSVYKEIQKYNSPSEVLKCFNINRIIGDARKTNLPDKSIDFVFSTLVFEHLTTELLSGLLLEFKRVAKLESVASHLGGIIDQYSMRDKSITPFNFYKYSDKQWKYFNNPIIPQGRLRVSDFRKIFKETGWNIIEENNKWAQSMI